MNERSIWCGKALLEDGWHEQTILSLDESGRITGLTAGPSGSADERLRGVVIPGMPNLHCHSFQYLMAGLTGAKGAHDDSFWSWRKAMYRLAGQVTPDQIEACAGWLYLEMLRKGYTACAEFHYLHHDPQANPYANPAETGARVVAAADVCGLGLTLLPVLYCRSGFGADGPEPEQRRFIHTPESFAALVDACRDMLGGRPLFNLGLAPHSLRAVSRRELLWLLETCWQPGMPFHIHIAEQRSEVEQCVHHLGARPIAWLLEHCPVDPHWCLVHATHSTREELAGMAERGAVAGLCPTTEADLGDGFFEAKVWQGLGGSFGIGSDSNVRVSPTEELRMLEYGARLRGGSRNVLADHDRSCGRLLYESACVGGGVALGQPVGKIAPGYRADLVVLDDEHPMLQGVPGDAVLDSYVFAGTEDMIRSVHVAGREVLDRGRHRQEDHLQRRFLKVARECRTLAG